jgi:hypothetical protein
LAFWFSYIDEGDVPVTALVSVVVALAIKWLAMRLQFSLVGLKALFSG